MAIRFSARHRIRAIGSWHKMKEFQKTSESRGDTLNRFGELPDTGDPEEDAS